MVTEYEHRPVGPRPELVEPFELRSAQLSARRPGHHRVENRERDARQLDLLRRVVRERLAVVRVVVPPHVVEAIAERVAVAVEELLVLFASAVGGEIALGHDCVGSQRTDLLDDGAVHHLRVRHLARPGREHGTDVEALDDPAERLAKVHVVDGGDAAELLTARSGQRAGGDAVEIHLGVGGQAFVPAHLRAVEDDRHVVSDGGQLGRHRLRPVVGRRRDVLGPTAT